MTIRSRLAAPLGRARFPWAPPNWPTELPRPAPERRVGITYDSAWARRYPARLARAVVMDNITRPLVHVVAAPEVRGAELLKLADPPVIFAANHSSHLDTPLLLSVLPVKLRHRTVVAAAADTFFDRRWKAHLWAGALNATPIERHRVNRKSADQAAQVLADGWSLVIFPEGGRSPDGWFQLFRGGAAYLAVRTGRPVVPVHIAGTWRLLPKGGSQLRRGRTTVRFGMPMRPAQGEDARRFGTRIETELAGMADVAGSDWWTARRRAASGTTPSPGGPEVSPWRRHWALGPGPAEADGHDPGRWAVH